MSAVVAIFIVILILGGVLGGVGVLRKRGVIGAELSRKAVHMGMGIVCMGFPWVFSEALPVQVLGVLSAGGILLLKGSSLRNRVGAALFSVERASVGEVLFPLAVAWLFTLGHHSPVLYVVPLLLLTFGDAFGALVGTRYGRSHYQTLSGSKSMEGSVTFFVISFLCTFISLWVFTDFSLLHVLLVSVAVSLIVTLLEGGASHGMDNLFIPVASFLILDYYLARSEAELVIRIIALAVLMGLLIGTRRVHTFDGAGVIGCILFGFCAFTLGGLPVFLSALVLFLRHLYISRRYQLREKVTHDLVVIFWVAVVPLMWLTLGRTETITYAQTQQGAILSLASLGMMLSIGTVAYLERPMGHLGSSVSVYFLISLPVFLVTGNPPLVVSGGLALVGGSIAFFVRKKSDPAYWVSIAGLALVQSLLLIS